MQIFNFQFSIFKKTHVSFGMGVFLMLVLITLDQLTKYISEKVFLNYNFAFSLPLPAWLMFVIYTGVLLYILKFIWQNFSKFTFATFLPWVLILSGAFSNIIERIILGYVRDWVYILSGVFNLADAYIISGIIILLLSSKYEAQNSKNN